MSEDDAAEHHVYHASCCISKAEVAAAEREAYRRGALGALTQLRDAWVTEGSPLLSPHLLTAFIELIERGEWPPKGEGDAG